MWSTEAAVTTLAGKPRATPSGAENDGIISGNTTNTMTGPRAPVVEEEEGEEEEVVVEEEGVITRSGAGWAPDRSALGTRESAASGEAA